MKICKCCRQPIKLDSKNLYIFDNGHGGIIDGVYQTPGKRSQFGKMAHSYLRANLTGLL